jgi:hypothetical protein
MAGRKRSGLANDRRAYCYSKCQVPQPPNSVCDILPKNTPYQICSPWPQFGGLDNTNCRQTSISASSNGNVHLLSTTNNSYVINTSPAIASDGTIYVGVNQVTYSDGLTTPIQGYLFAYNPNGTLKWTYMLQKPAYNTALLSVFNSSTPAIGNDGTIYFGTEVNNPGTQGYAGPVGKTFVYAVNSDGTLKWVRNDIVPTNASQPPPNNSCNSVIVSASLLIGSDNSLYFGCYANSSKTPTQSSSLFSLNSSNGQTNWEVSGSSLVSSTTLQSLLVIEIQDSVAIDNSGNVYFICNSNYNSNTLVYLISLTSTGTFRYFCDLNNGNTTSVSIYGRPVLSVDNTVVYAMSRLSNGISGNYYLYSINAESGDTTLIQTISFNNGLYFNNSMCRDKNDNLYFSIVADYNSVVYSVNKNGVINWSYIINAPTVSGSVAIIDDTPAIGSDGTLFFHVWLTDFDTIGSYYLYAINSNGTLKQYKIIPNVSNYTHLRAINTSPSINSKGNIIVSFQNATNSSTNTFSNLYSFT